MTICAFMEFSEYYKTKNVVESYESKRAAGLKGRVFRILERIFLEKLVKGKGKSILEAGVGTGFITEILRKHGKVEGFDISEEMIKTARKKFKGMKITKDNILDLNIKKKYDAVVSIRVISHFDFKDAVIALNNLKRICKKGGYVIFNLENRSFIRRFMRKILKWGSTKNYQYSISDIRRLAEDSGLKIDKIIYLDHLFLLPLHFINKLAGNSLENFIIRLENKLENLRFMSNNSFIRCRA